MSKKGDEIKGGIRMNRLTYLIQVVSLIFMQNFLLLTTRVHAEDGLISITANENGDVFIREGDHVTVLPGGIIVDADGNVPENPRWPDDGRAAEGDSGTEIPGLPGEGSPAAGDLQESYVD